MGTITDEVSTLPDPGERRSVGDPRAEKEGGTEMRRVGRTRHATLRPGLSMGALALALGTSASAGDEEVALDESRIFIEFNASANDLGFHVFVDGEDWRKLRIRSPAGRTIFAVEGRGAFGELGLTELFFEGAEPSLDEFPREELLALFPEGEYEFEGRTAGGEELGGEATLTHAVPAPPAISAQLGADDELVIRWEPVTEPAEGFEGPIEIVAYQVLVDSFQVTLPAASTSVTVPPELVASLGAGPHGFEVLAIDASGNQTIAEGSFERR